MHFILSFNSIQTIQKYTTLNNLLIVITTTFKRSYHTYMHSVKEEYCSTMINFFLITRTSNREKTTFSSHKYRSISTFLITGCTWQACLHHSSTQTFYGLMRKLQFQQSGPEYSLSRRDWCKHGKFSCLCQSCLPTEFQSSSYLTW